ncbi:lipocalin-like domain-containing protein [Faecalibacter macacae]|uniref:Lipocalin-like domain-containing protein n=1 Tax=Faecalibacter macacae TaxID=1859289 RepID=A0A3L9MG31_9FLAO|nr:lipocalin family protein [Faecalibacter macacae]RLZ11741.1 hypothetical protein EAH69_04795 [Faecalibacter macacae]
MKKILFSSFILLSSIGFGQQLKPEQLVGFWKLKDAGFYEDGKKISKDFDNCRLLRNFTIWGNSYAIYNYTEGSDGNCIPTEPRLTYWRIVENRIQFYIDDYIHQEEVVKINADNTITFETYLKEKVVDKDKFFEKIANTISYQILEKQN